MKAKLLVDIFENETTILAHAGDIVELIDSIDGAYTAAIDTDEGEIWFNVEESQIDIVEAL